MMTDGSVSTSAFLIRFKTVALLLCPETRKNDSGVRCAGAVNSIIF